MSAIVLEDVRRVFHTSTGTIRRKKKDVVALDGVSFEVAAGELFGVLGPNGAGKTTTIKILTTLLTPTSGTARVLDLDVVRDAKALRPRIGFVFGGERGLYYRVSARENLTYFGHLYAVEPGLLRRRVETLLDLVGLSDRADERVEGYSRGMKQRLHLARMLMHDPEVLFLDEPTIGLDPVGARELREVIARLHREGKTIVLTTHYMFEADALCQRIAVIDGGRVAALGTPRDLKAGVSDLSIVEIEVFGASPELVASLERLDIVESVVVEQREMRQVLRVQTALGERAVATLLPLFGGLQVGRVAVREATLEDAYVRLVGKVE